MPQRGKIRKVYRVLVIDLAIAFTHGHQLPIAAPVVGGIEARLATRLVDHAVGDRAQEVVVLRIASVLLVFPLSAIGEMREEGEGIEPCRCSMAGHRSTSENVL
jgi:hypothetical protein